MMETDRLLQKTYNMAFNSNYLSTPSKDIPNWVGLRWSHCEPVQMHRSDFSKDRDRILYSKSFLRLRGKTQVFMLQKNDYIRTRMTHSLEVNQLAKSIASALGHNLDLTEAIALGHDVVHTPFGHVGERTLADILKEEIKVPDDMKGFKHNLQALRLLCDLEKGADYPRKKGLNLTKFTLWGIAHHSSVNRKKDAQGNPLEPIQTDHPIYDSYLREISEYWSFEGMIVALADEIAQRHHDIEDSLRYGIIKRDELLEEIEQFKPIWKKQEKEVYNRLKNECRTLDEPVFNSLFARLVVNMYVTHAINSTKENLKALANQYSITKRQDFLNVKSSIPSSDYNRCVTLGQELYLLDVVFQQYLKNKVLSSFQAQAMDGKAEYIIRKLFEAFKMHPSQLPDTALFSFAGFINVSPNRKDVLSTVSGNETVLCRCIADYIGGMTDQFAYDEFDRLYGTKV